MFKREEASFGERAAVSKKVELAYAKAAIVNGDSLSSHWLSSLNEMVIDTSWDALHTNYSRLVEPWTASVPGSGAISQKIPLVGVATGAKCGIDLKAEQTALGMQELHDFISVYQKIRQVRAEALAAELYRLADIYDEYPEFLKQPLAPKTRRLNKKHIPTGMRNEARKMTKRIVHASWRYGERYKYHFAFPFPGLIPYDWTLQLFKEVVEKSAVSDLPHRKGIAENVKVVHDGLPTWTWGANEQVNRWSPEKTKDMQTPGTTPKMWEKTYQTHPEEDLVWLQKFCEVVAQVKEMSPKVLEDVRGPDWVIGAPQ